MRLRCGRNLRHDLLGRGQTTARCGIVRRQFDCATPCPPHCHSPHWRRSTAARRMDSRHVGGANWDSRHLGGSRMRFHLPFRLQHLDQHGDDGIAFAHLNRFVIGIERQQRDLLVVSRLPYSLAYITYKSPLYMPQRLAKTGQTSFRTPLTSILREGMSIVYYNRTQKTFVKIVTRKHEGLFNWFPA